MCQILIYFILINMFTLCDALIGQTDITHNVTLLHKFYIFSCVIEELNNGMNSVYIHLYMPQVVISFVTMKGKNGKHFG